MSAIAASVLQYGGTPSGYLFNPVTNATLLSTPGMSEALRIWRGLAPYNYPYYRVADNLTQPDVYSEEADHCAIYEDFFNTGQVGVDHLHDVPTPCKQLGLGQFTRRACE